MSVQRNTTSDVMRHGIIIAVLVLITVLVLAIERCFSPSAIAKNGPHFLTIGFTFLAFLYGLKLYDYFTSIKQLEKLHDEAQALARDARKVSEDAQSLTHEMTAMSKVFAGLFESIGDLLMARYEIGEQNAALAATIAEAAVESLEKRGEALLPHQSHFRVALNELILQTLDVQARCNFDRRRYHELGKIANKMIKTDDKSWRGHHWLGVHFLGMKKIDSELATDALLASTARQGGANRDLLNLSELYLDHHKFGEALKFAVKFLEHAERFVEEEKVEEEEKVKDKYMILGEFYEALSGYIDGKDWEEYKVRPLIKRLIGPYKKTKCERYDSKLILRLWAHILSENSIGRRDKLKEIELIIELIDAFIEWTTG